jgi:phenylalanyl-tRNA synthetase beta chain
VRITRNWLREFADVDLDAGALSELLSDLGLEVEDVRPVGEVPEGVVVARVLDVRPHPDADRIRLVDVDPGDGGPLQICCGASNMSVGDLVALATVGTTMPDGMSIAARRMRGEESNGMLCSSRELGLGEDHDGILILQPGPLPGTALGPALGLESDLVVEVDVLPNRPDALSVLGVARDVAARLGLPFDVTRPDPVLVDGDLDGASVQVSDAGLCGRFAEPHLRPGGSPRGSPGGPPGPGR